MDLSKEKLLEYQKRILLSRLRILMNHGFYGLLLMHMKLTIDVTINTAATDGEKLYFDPSFLDEISDDELDFVMMHEILHVALRHCFRGEGYDQNLFNIACDIVVNSNILKSNDMNLDSITLDKYGVSMHLTPDKKEGYLYTAEEVYQMLINNADSQSSQSKKGKSNNDKSKNNSSNNDDSSDNSKDENKNQKNSNSSKGKQGKTSSGNDLSEGVLDNHSKWNESKELDEGLSDLWVQRVKSAAEAIKNQQEVMGCGNVPSSIERLIKELVNPQIDWREMLNDFVQENVCDYSFNPPDKRFNESPFFLPDLNDSEMEVNDILFMIDTSGSINDKMLMYAYSEIKGAIDQFDGMLQGWLGFFDAMCYDPIEFCSEDELLKIKPIGGGGTNFDVIFEYVFQYMNDKIPKSIIILTDGYAPFPTEEIARDIPVLWLINNDKVTPPWGKIARIKI